jgi:nitrite reductase/ring-hydroxylating ferredoxin subunit
MRASRSMADLPVPSGWFAIAFSGELPPGAVVTRTVGGRELVVWRGRDGVVSAVDPTCPHLGAHLGAGRVDGQTLRCPFHRFAFAADGRCTATGTAALPPTGLRVPVHPVCERHGAVLVWHHPRGAAPTFEVPEPPATATTPMATGHFALAGHPVATSENSVDLTHLAEVHGYDGVRMLEPFEADGPVARASYEMRRPLGLPGTQALPGLRRARMLVRFDVTLYGLGVSIVEATVPALDVRTRQLVLSTPTEPGHIELRLGMRIERRDPGSAPLRMLENLGARLAMAGFRHDVRQDLPIWARQRYVERPGVGRSDGPIVRYRRWAQQFLDDEAAGLETQTEP